MAAVDYIMNVRASLDALADLLAEAADDGRPVSEIAEEALALLNDARSVLDTSATSKEPNRCYASFSYPRGHPGGLKDPLGETAPCACRAR